MQLIHSVQPGQIVVKVYLLMSEVLSMYSENYQSRSELVRI